MFACLVWGGGGVGGEGVGGTVRKIICDLPFGGGGHSLNWPKQICVGLLVCAANL